MLFVALVSDNTLLMIYVHLFQAVETKILKRNDICLFQRNKWARNHLSDQKPNVPLFSFIVPRSACHENTI